MIELRLERFLGSRIFTAFTVLLLSALPFHAAAGEETSAQVTYAKDIAPLLWKHCAGCHRAGEVGDFPLLTYKEASKRADFVAKITASRRMPPWKAEADFGKFCDERRLSDDEITLISRWAQAGAPEGDPKILPKPPEFTEGWQLGDPDLVLTMSKPFSVPAEGRDVYRCFVIPIPMEDDRMVSAVEFRPGNRKVVHHAILFLDAHGAARRKDGKDGQPGFSTFGGPGFNPTGGLGTWVPGAMPRFLPDGIAKYVKQGSDLVLQIHYHPSGKPEEDQSVVGIYFSKKPVEKIVTGIAILQTEMVIPPGDAHCMIEAQCQPLPVDVNVLGVSPHMHNLGRDIKVTAQCPNRAEEVPLIWIKDWYFNWQGAYQFQDPFRLPKGSVIKVQAVYDNSPENPKNPNHPPKEVRWGEQTVDEMCLCSVQLFTDKLADSKLIVRMRGNELGPGLEGGIPNQVDLVKRRSTSKKELGKHESIEKKLVQKIVDSEKIADSEAPPAETSQKQDPVFPPEGLAIPEETQYLLNRYDTDKDGKLTRKEFSKMPPAMQAYFFRRAHKR